MMTGRSLKIGAGPATARAGWVVTTVVVETTGCGGGAYEKLKIHASLSAPVWLLINFMITPLFAELISAQST